jgi:hypothetical protein
MEKPDDSLSSELLAFARSLNLLVTEEGSILFTSSQGAGFDLDRYITSYDGVPHIEVVLERHDENEQPIGLHQMLISDPIDDITARELMMRWAVLEKLEDDYDGRLDMPDAVQARERVLNDLLGRLNPGK